MFIFITLKSLKDSYQEGNMTFKYEKTSAHIMLRSYYVRPCTTYVRILEANIHFFFHLNLLISFKLIFRQYSGYSIRAETLSNLRGKNQDYTEAKFRNGMVKIRKLSQFERWFQMVTFKVDILRSALILWPPRCCDHPCTFNNYRGRKSLSIFRP